MRRPLIKLALMTVSFVAMVGMLLYKFKYEQMKNIVEGAGLEAVERYIHSSNLVPPPIRTGVDIQFDRPFVSWVNISGYFVYSAFHCSASAGSIHHEFCSVGYGPSKVPDLECNVWFDLGKETLSVPGTLTFYTSKVEGSSYVYYEFRCALKMLKSIHRKPYLFVLKTPDHKSKIFTPIFQQKATSTTNRFAICVLPDILGNEWRSMMEFIVYHEIIGFTDILVYDYGINFSFLNKMRYLINTGTGKIKSISVLRWDLPSIVDPVSNILIEKDCIFRTTTLSNFTVISNWNQYIVPNDGGTVDTMLKSLGEKKTFKTVLPSKRCCTDAFDAKDSEKRWPVILRKNLCIPNNEKHVIYANAQPDPPVLSSPNFAELLTFAQCQGLSLNELIPVTSMWTYKSLILSSKLLYSWRESKRHR